MNIPRFLSGFIEFSDTVWLQSARLSGTIQPLGTTPVNIGLQTNPFGTVFANTFSNLNGVLQVNRVIPELPIKVDTSSGGIAKVGLLFDNMLQLDSMGRLGVKSQITPSGTEFTFDAPLFFDSTNSNVSLLYETEDFKVNGSKLTLVPDLWKPRGGPSISGSIADALGVLGELTEFSDITLPDTPVHSKILQLKTSDDFTQSGGPLQIKGKTPGCVPFYKIGNGFAVNSNFYYDDTTLSVRFVKIENSFQLQDEYASSVGYVNQAHQSSDSTSIDISAPQNGRRMISVRTDNTTIKIDPSTNKLTSALTYEQPLSITNSQVSLSVDGSTLIKSGNMLKGGYTAGRGIVITGNTITTDEELDLTFDFPLVKVGTNVRLDMSGIDPISVNDLTGLDIKVDNSTIKKDPTIGLKGGYAAKSGSAINVIGNLIGENLTASSGVIRVGNDLRGNYSGVGMVYISGSSIGIREEDLDQRIKDKTGISQPDSGGGGGIAAGVSLGGAAVSIGSTLSHGFGYGASGISAGNLEDNQGGWGLSLGNATLLYPDVYTDNTKSVCAIGYLKGSSNTTIVDSESPTTGTLCVLGGASVYKNLHNFKPLSWQPNLSHYYTRYEVDAITSTFASRDSAYSKFEANQLFKPFNGQPDLSTLVSKDSVYSKEESDGRYKPIDYQVDLSNYYTRYEADAITSTFASRDSVYSKFEANQLFKPLSWQPDLSPFALSNNVYSKTEVDQRFDDIGFYLYTKDQADARFLPVNYNPPEVDLSPYVLRTTSDQLYKPITYEPDAQPWALKSDLVDFLPFPLAQQLYYERSEIDLNFPTKEFLSESHYTKIQSDNLLSNYYQKGESDAIYVQSATLGNYYTKGESDAIYVQSPTLGNYYTKGESDGLYVQPSGLTSCYTKAQSDSRYLLTGSSILAGGNVALQYNTLFLGNN
ncbi:hypothetical protein HK104_002703, partial [Borealophlyctis nickersoniae]